MKGSSHRSTLKQFAPPSVSVNCSLRHTNPNKWADRAVQPHHPGENAPLCAGTPMIMIRIHQISDIQYASKSDDLLYAVRTGALATKLGCGSLGHSSHGRRTVGQERKSTVHSETFEPSRPVGQPSSKQRRSDIIGTSIVACGSLRSQFRKTTLSLSSRGFLRTMRLT